MRCPQVVERLAKIDCVFVDKPGTFETDGYMVKSVVVQGHEWVSQMDHAQANQPKEFDDDQVN